MVKKSKKPNRFRNTTWTIAGVLMLIGMVVATTVITDTGITTSQNVTSQNYLGNNSQGATFIIASSTSINKQVANYICDGDSDDVEIQQAIDRLPAWGGKIILLEGTFNITSPINLTYGTHIEGMGIKSTLLDGDQHLNDNMVQWMPTTTGYFVKLSSMAIYGNDMASGNCTYFSAELGGYPRDVYLEDMFINECIEYGIVAVSPWGYKFMDIIVENSNMGAIYMSKDYMFYSNSSQSVIHGGYFSFRNGGDYAVYLNNVTDVVISNNQFSFNNKTGLLVNGSNNVIMGNVFNSNGIETASPHLILSTNSSNNTIIGNTFTVGEGSITVPIQDDGVWNIFTGNAGVSMNTTLFSPDGTRFSCGVNNTGSVVCS